MQVLCSCPKVIANVHVYGINTYVMVCMPIFKYFNKVYNTNYFSKSFALGPMARLYKKCSYMLEFRLYLATKPSLNKSQPTWYRLFLI